MRDRLYGQFLLLGHLGAKKLGSLLFFCFLCGWLRAQPTIATITPLSGPTGTTVTITGTNFNPIARNNTVYFGALKATVIAASATSLTVAVPIGATFEPLTVTANNLTAISEKIFTVTFACGGTINTSSFTAPVKILGGQTYNIKNADLDGDGKTDIIYSNGNVILILKNTSNGTTVSFVQDQSIAAACCYKFDVADLDGDGKLDLVLPNACNDLVSVIKNNSTPGTFSFASKIDYTTGDYPYAVAVGNLDGDGKPDLAVVNMDGNTLSVFKNTSAGGVLSFGTKTDYAILRQCRDVAITDLDGDNNADIAVTSQSNQALSLFRNQSGANNILLSARTDLATTAGAPEDVVVADFDGDAKPDLAISNNNTAGNISVYRNTSAAGSFSFSPRKEFLTGPYPFRMTAADLNGDGKPDLAVKDQYTATLTLLENNSTGSNILFAPKVDLPTPSAEREQLTIGDFNGDGKPDIAVSDFKTSGTLVFLNGPAPVSITATYTVPTCNGYDGSIIVKALGGQPPFQYKLGTLPYQNTGEFTRLPPGAHLVRVKDATGCLDSMVVTLPSSYLGFTFAVTDADCNQNNGSITINAGGSNLPLTYSLNSTDFQSTPQFNNIAPGIYNVYVKDNIGCTSQTGFVIHTACMSIVPAVTNSTCGFGNGRIQLQASGGLPPYQYSLDGVQYTNNTAFTNLTAKDYTVYARDASGKTVTATVTVANTAGPVLSSVEVTSTDCIQNSGTATIKGQGGTPPFQYVLDAVTFQSNPVFSSLAAGNYKLTIQDANGCFDSRTATIPVNNTITVTAGDDLTICEGAGATIDATSNAGSFSWSPATALSNVAVLTPVVTAKTTTTYIITATLGLCTAKDTVTVKVNPAPIPSAGKDTVICPGRTITLTGSGGIAYAWSPAAYLSDASSPTPVMSGAPKGNYVYALTATDSKGCPSLQPAILRVSVVSPVVEAGRDTVILANRPVQLHASNPGNFNFVQYSWSPATGLSNAGIADPVVTTDKDRVYTLTAKTGSGCTATDEVNIKVYTGVEIYVPTAFTPNNDGRNDVLKAIPAGIKEFRYLNIYNRWGQLIFQSKEASKGWDGKQNGSVQTGVVIWIAEGVDYNGNVIRRQGTTTVIQ